VCTPVSTTGYSNADREMLISRNIGIKHWQRIIIHLLEKQPFLFSPLSFRRRPESSPVKSSVGTADNHLYFSNLCVIPLGFLRAGFPPPREQQAFIAMCNDLYILYFN